MRADHIARTPREQLDPARTALVVVDMQNDFCHEQGYLARERSYDLRFVGAVAAQVSQAIDRARELGVQVVWLRSVYDFKYLTSAYIAKRGSEGCCMEGSWGVDFFQVAPREGELVIDKHSFSGFADTQLDLQLRKRGIETLMFCGVATNVCVDSTLRDGFFLGYYVVLLEDCVGSNSKVGHEGTLATVRNNIGAVLKAAQACEMLAA